MVTMGIVIVRPFSLMRSMWPLAARALEHLLLMGLHYSQIKLTAICTVCADHFVHELNDFIKGVAENMPAKVVAS